MRLVDYLDKGASLGPDAPCLTTDGETLTYAEVQQLSYRIAAGLAASGVRPGGKVAILSANDPIAFSCVFGISRAGAIWCPINPRNEAAENRELLDQFDCEVLIYQDAFTPLVDKIRNSLPKVHTFVCLDGEPSGSGPSPHLQGVTRGPGPADFSPAGRSVGWGTFCGGVSQPATNQPAPAQPATNQAGTSRPAPDLTDPDDLAMIVGTGGTTGRPKGVMLGNSNLETMTALTLMGYPFGERPVYLALAPLTHAAGVLCFPVLASGGEIVIMRTPDVHAFLELIPRHGVTHTFLPPTLIYMVLAAPELDSTDLSSLRCFWYGAAPMSVSRLEEALTRIGPVMAQLFGQTEAPMMISILPPAGHFDAAGNIAGRRLSSAGRPSPLVTVAIMAADGTLLPRGERGEIVVRGSLVMKGYYRNPEATADASAYGWHHTGDIGYLDDENYLYIVDRAKDMIITGGFNVYSTEVEQALMAHTAVQDCAVIGQPDEKWGERVVAVVQLQPGASVDAAELIAFAKGRIGSVKAPKEVLVWPDLPRSKVGKVLKPDIKARLAAAH